MIKMAKPVRIVLVTAKHHPLHGKWVEVAQRVAKELGLQLEIREEDYMFLNEYGDKDEYGMAWLPQLFVVMDNGKVQLLLSKMPLTKDHKPDVDTAIKTVLEKLRTQT